MIINSLIFEFIDVLVGDLSYVIFIIGNNNNVSINNMMFGG